MLLIIFTNYVSCRWCFISLLLKKLDYSGCGLFCGFLPYWFVFGCSWIHHLRTPRSVNESCTSVPGEGLIYVQLEDRAVMSASDPTRETTSSQLDGHKDDDQLFEEVADRASGDEDIVLEENPVYNICN